MTTAQTFREAASLCTDMEWHHLLLAAAEQREALEEVLADYKVLQDLWEDVGRHIDKAAIGYNHPQILAVFRDNQTLREQLDAMKVELIDARHRIMEMELEKESWN